MLRRGDATEGRMGEARGQGWRLDEFLAWEADQPGRWEPIDGRPMMMTGGAQAHSLAAINVTSALRRRLRGSPCRPAGSDLRVVTGNENVRYPDALIDCGALRPEAREASEPAIAFEVPSRSTAWIDLHIKLRDYDATPSLRLHVDVSPDTPWVALWSRDPSGRPAGAAALSALADTIALDPSGAQLTFAEISDDLALPPASPT